VAEMYFPTMSSYFKEDEYRNKVKNQLKYLQENVESLIFWNKKYTDECNTNNIFDSNKCKYNQDYLELQRLINKFLGE
jgi:hypothetical protein